MTQLRSVTYHSGSHSVTLYPTQVNTHRLNPMQPDRPVLDLPTPEGWKAELTRVTSIRIARWFTRTDRHPS